MTSPENLKKQAKSLLKKWRAGESETLARIRAAHPQYKDLKPLLTHAQLVLAREHGFESWPQMKVAVQAANQELANQFVNLACLCYDDPHYDHRSFHTRAHDLLVNHPELVEANIWAASAAGNTTAVAALLRGDPELVNRPGPYGWAPLLCACYSRVPGISTYEVAKLLLDRGADPNAFTLKHNDPPGSDRARRFTALTGVFGGGSTGLVNQPPHPQWRELAELLIARGANPADEQALWINQAASLEFLLRSGAIPLLGRELSRAARDGHEDRVRLLMAHGARVNDSFEGKTAWRHAIDSGHLRIARLLEEAGASTTELDDGERFTSLIMAGDEPGARGMLSRDPGLLNRAPKSMVILATNTGRVEAVRLALDLGFDPDYVDEIAALHTAAGRDSEEIVRLLLERGASPAVREPFYHATPVGWADFFDQTRMRDLLLNESAICLFDALDFNRLDRVPDILARDPAALERPFPGTSQTPLARMIDRGNSAAVRILLEHGAYNEPRP